MFGYCEVLIFSQFYNKNSSYINTLLKKWHYTLDHKLHSVKKRSETSQRVSGCSSHGCIIGPVCDFKIESNLEIIRFSGVDSPGGFSSSSHHSARVKTLIPGSRCPHRTACCCWPPLRPPQTLVTLLIKLILKAVLLGNRTQTAARNRIPRRGSNKKKNPTMFLFLHARVYCRSSELWSRFQKCY